ncbi:MAG: PilZ domain-containing protein [Alphaproteobacteria bacterium]|nr:PilZ domain-containing protein [Alphaproteobacteria bacterium]
MKSATQQVVHESETQRQHVRIQIPARAELGGRTYMVKDLSVSGLSIEDVGATYIDGAQIDLTLNVPFESFSLNVALKAFVTHYDTNAKVLGAQFTNLSREQLSILNAIIQSYMSGVIIKEGDLLNVVARDNFVKIRKEISKEEKRDLGSLAKRAMPFLFMGVAAILGGFFVMGNVYEKMLVLKSYQAVVTSESIVLRASAPGIFKSAIADGTEKVTKGQVLGTLEVSGAYVVPGATAQAAAPAPAATPATEATPSADGAVAADATAAPVVTPAPVTTKAGTTLVSIVSPCDCYMTKQYVQDGLFRDIGEAVFKLVPTDTKPNIKATISAEDVVRLNLRDKATMRVTGEEGVVVGTVQDIETLDANAASSIVTIRPERPLSYKLTDRPAYVEFYVH